MLAFFVASLGVLGAADVTVRPLQGESAEGRIVALSDKGVTVETSEGQKEFPAAALHQVRVRDSGLETNDAMPEQGTWVELVDDSQFVAASFQLSKGSVSLGTSDPQSKAFPARIVRSIRFMKPEDATNKQWNEMQTSQRAGDILVVRKASTGVEGVPAEIVLDQLEGIVHEVKNASINFEYEGERIDVPRARLEGILFRLPTQSALPDPICRVEELTGAVWNARTLATESDQVRLTSVAGAEIVFPLSRLKGVDFSAANLVFLSDLEPESAEWRPYFQSPATPASLVKWFQPKRDQGVDGEPLTLNGQSFEKGLALHSRSLLSYRLTKSFGRFIATVGLENRVRTTGNLSLQVFADERPVLTRTIRGDEEPFEVDLEIRNARRLKILVDFGEDRSDAGDWLYLGNARLVK